MATETFHGNALIERYTDTRLFTTGWQSVFDIINTNLEDPDSRGTKFIYGSYPDEAMEDVSYYPLVIIDKTAFRNETIDAIDRNTQTYRMTIDIVVFSTKASELDSLSDSIVEIIMSNQTSLPWNPTFTTSTDNFYTRGGKRIHTRTITFEFEYIMELS